MKEENAGMRRVRTISVFGLTESEVAERLIQIKPLFPQFRLEIESKFPDIQLAVYADTPDASGVEEALETAVKRVRRTLGIHVYSDTGQTMEQVVGMLLYEKNATLAVAESCTGGLIANLLTDVPGSSQYFLFSAVTYANQAKIKILGVRAATLEKNGAVSVQTAREMARGAKKVVKASYGLATSGVAGPDGGTDDKPVGTVCIGLATPLSASGHRFNFADHNRKANKQIFAITALDLLRKELMGAKPANASTS